MKPDNRKTDLKHSFKSSAVIKGLHDDGRKAKIKISDGILEHLIVIRKRLTNAKRTTNEKNDIV